MKNKSLKKEIQKLIIVFSIFVIVVIGIIAIVNQYNSKIKEIKHNQNLVLKQVEEEINNLTLKIEFVANYISNNYPGNKDLLKNVVDTNLNISSILVLSKEGIIEDFYALSNLNINKGFDYSKKEYFKKIKKSSDTYWSNVFLSTVNEVPSISYSFKMNDKIGVFMINISELSNFMLRFKNHNGSHMIRIYDKNGIIIVNPDNKQLVLERFNVRYSEVFTKLINIKQAFEHAIFKNKNGEKSQFGSYTKIEKTAWYVIVRESHNYILKSLDTIVYYFAFAILLFIIISIFLSLRISKNIFKSFDDMQDITSKIASGDYNVKLKISEYDEFNKLLESFNSMQIEIDKREDILENSLASFKALFNSTMESVMLHENGICFDVNDVTLKLFRAKSKDELIGKKIADFITEESKEILKANIDRETETYELGIIRVDGTRIDALVQGKFLELNGRVVKVSAIIDITELKRKDQLLFQQSKMASMGEMIGNIAHQWRQPLSIISTCASGVKFEKEFAVLSDERLNESMDMIVKNTQYLSKTIDDFRNFFRSDKKIEEFTLEDILNKALLLLNSSLKSHEINIVTKFSDSEFKLKGYPNEFIQVLINIINNSKDAFISNKIENRYIEIEEINDKNLYRLHIKDNAGGIAPNIIDRIFDPYFTTKHKSKGTGIGLYMSHQIIVDHMKGNIFVKNIEIESPCGLSLGSCFCIEFDKNI
ncbi:MAG: hypothetical protein C0625_03015 [Arcobacter sp.]|nr:MAG: hypothetical protein C0625_03015 [Arcobacter sp.]